MIEILQLEDSTRQTLSEMNSTVQKVNYVSYEKKKSKGNKNKQKIQNNSNGSNSSSSEQKQASTGTGKQCYRCKKPFTKGHEKVCKAINAKCDACGITGHYQIACRKSGNFPQKANSTSNSTGKMNIAAAVRGIPQEADFFDERGLLKEYQPKVMNVLSGTSSSKPMMIEFGCGLTPLSIDRKLPLLIDTGADANAINKKTFDLLFPEVKLEESSFCLQNFDKRLIKPIGSFRCFLRWQGHKYRVQIVVMNENTPNILSRETTFLMGILKKCFVSEKVSIEQNTQNPILVSDPTTRDANPSTEGVFCHPVPPAAATVQIPSTEGVLSHSNPSTEAVFCHSVTPAEATEQHPSTEVAKNTSDPSTEAVQMNVASTNSPIKPSLSITDLPLTQEKVESTYADVFQGLGKFPGEPYKLRLKPDAVPAKHRPRKVPVHLQEAFHEEVERLVKIDVLEPVTEPTEWVNSFVVVEKVIDSSNAHSPHHSIKKSIRLCIDPKDLNEALEREPYYSRSVDELISMFAGAKVFTIVDMDKGYWQVVLHPDSRKYTCMAFDIGRYQFKRLPMGSKVASDIFQRMLDSVYIGLPGVTGIADDMVIFGRNEEEHDRNLILFLEATRKNGLVLNKRKLQFKKEEVSFFGHRWNSTEKTESILRMEFPPDKETMHSFLGLVNFLNRYTPRLAELCSPLRKLILKDSHYSPGDPEHAAFSAIKAEFKKKIILPYFDRNKQTILQTDASKKGFGAVILQEEQPIYYASRALTSAEKNYQNLEREAQAAVWGMEKFHYFLYGRKFILQTDQKPLVSIFRKHMIDVSPRIQRITIRAWQYEFEPQHIAGKNNVISDALSRVTPLEFQDSNADKHILAVNFLQHSSIEEREKDEVLQETLKDKEFQSLKHYISTGWPSKRSQIPTFLHPY